MEVKPMKELYQNADMEIVEFSVEDIIATSDMPQTHPGINPNCENEGPPNDAFL